MFFQGFFRNSLNYTKKKKKKNLLFPEMRVTRKIYTQAAANLFFYRYSGDILFSFLIFFAFFILVFCLFICLFFLKIKMYIPIHIWQYGRVSDKKIFTRPISGNNTTFIVASRSSLFLEKVNFLKLTIKTGLNHVKLFHSRESRHHHNYFIDLVLMYL